MKVYGVFTDDYDGSYLHSLHREIETALIDAKIEVSKMQKEIDKMKEYTLKTEGEPDDDYYDMRQIDETRWEGGFCCSGSVFIRELEVK